MEQVAEKKETNELLAEWEADLELRFDFHRHSFKSPAAKRTGSRFLAPLAAFLLLAFPAGALATEYSIKLEPGAVIPLSAPQSDVYGIGGGLAVKPLASLTSYLDIGPTLFYSYMPGKASGAEAGTAWGIGGGLRLKAPRDRESYYGISPWLDADALYVRTGSFNRGGFDAGLGLAVPIGESRTYWAGPFVRYFQTLTDDRDGYDTRDAKLLTAGISLEFGSAK